MPVPGDLSPLDTILIFQKPPSIKEEMIAWMCSTCDEWQQYVAQIEDPLQCPVCGCWPQVVNGGLLYVHGGDLVQ